LEEIKVGERHRSDLGNIKALAASMTEVGLLHPVVITPDNRLIAGQRRLVAARSLGWEDIDVTVARNITEAGLLLQAEAEENSCRKDFTPTEAEAIATAREEVLAPLAQQAKAQAKGERRGVKDSSAKLTGETRKTAATGTGFSATTIRKVRDVKSVATDETVPEPVREKARDALREMDATGKVDGPHKKVKQASTYAQAVTEFPELAHYEDRPREAVDLAVALRGYSEPERSRRRDNLAKSIAADVRRGGPFQTDPPPEAMTLADRMFLAVNDAARAITAAGGPAMITDALPFADPIEVENWRSQFDDMARTCMALASACAPKLRSVK